MSAIAITPGLIAQHQLTESEYRKIVGILGREPNYTELGVFSVMWSEHCSYKSSRLHLKKLPTRGKLVVQGPGENAGVVDIGGGYVIAFKIESHNHPSFIEPFQGAATGVGGILRDIFTMGARPIAVLDSLRFGPLANSGGGRRRTPATAASCRVSSPESRTTATVLASPPSVANASLSRATTATRLVNVFALGVARKEDIFYASAAGVGNPVIYVGAKTGRDGIHGASMASAEFTEESKQKRPNVQVGDPFMEKLLLEACIEAMQTGAIVAIQDMGAAGLTCSTCEMGSRGGTGIQIELDLVPQRETGMTPYEIMLSESQERMLLVAAKGREDEVFHVFRKWGLDAVTIGEVTGDGLLRVKQHGATVAEIPNRELADEAPLYDRPYVPPPTQPAAPSAPLPPIDPTEALKKLLASSDVCGKRYIWEQYDYMVRTNTISGPGADAAVVRIKENGVSVAMSLDGNSRYCYLSAREGARLAVAESCRNLAVVGAQPVAATNCLNFGNPERPEIMGQLVDAIEGISEACSFFDAPITGGNVSLYNETLGEGIWPTPVMGIVGLMQTAAPVTRDFKAPGRPIVLLGGIGDCDQTRFGGTEYAKVIAGELWGLPPALDMDYEKRVHDAMREIVAAGLAESAHDLSDGGLAVAAAECSQGGVGAALHFESDLAPEFLLFHEAPSRILLSTAKPQAVAEIAARHRVAAPQVGITANRLLSIGNRGAILISAGINDLIATIEGSLEKQLQSQTV